jgi:hypothetical protein
LSFLASRESKPSRRSSTSTSGPRMALSHSLIRRKRCEGARTEQLVTQQMSRMTKRHQNKAYMLDAFFAEALVLRSSLLRRFVDFVADDRSPYVLRTLLCFGVVSSPKEGTRSVTKEQHEHFRAENGSITLSDTVEAMRLSIYSRFSTAGLFSTLSFLASRESKPSSSSESGISRC